MAEQTFKSPGFFEREIEIISRPLTRNTAVPAGLIGTSERGPAFVPTTVNSREEFIRIFGPPQRSRVATQAMAEFFRNAGKALTFCRTLGTGDKSGNNAGFKLTHTSVEEGAKLKGAVHFIAAEHTVNDAEFIGLGSFNDNDSITTNMDTSDDGSTTPDANADKTVELVRAMIFTHKDYAVKIFNTTENDAAADTDDLAIAVDSKFKIVFDADGTKTDALLVSLDPDSDDYISKVLNTDPHAIEEHKHFLYAHFPVDDVVASVAGGKVVVLHGDTSSTDYASLFGDFSTKFTSPQTPSFISQPFGSKEYNLFHFESLDDGSYASGKYKISISNLKASTDPTDAFGTFTVSVRDLKDTDESPIIYESFNRCSLNPDAENFIAKVIGDQKIYYDLSPVDEDERRLVREGSFRNVSQKIRVVVNKDVLEGEVPQKALPFGFRGVPALILNDKAKDHDADTSSTKFVTGKADSSNITNNHKGSVLPPLPSRFKITKGSIKTSTSYSQTFLGEASASENVDFSLHWGFMTERVKDINNANSGTAFNEIASNYLKFLGKESSATIATGALADTHNNNKFSLAKVALKSSTLSGVTGSINDVFKDAAYVRNADVGSDKYDSASHLILMHKTNDPFSGENATNDAQAKRVSLAKLLAEDPVKFNKYTLVAKFTAPVYGGFDGVNILDKDSTYMNDRSASTESGGKAGTSGFSSPLKGTDAATKMQGAEESNNIISSYKNAVRIMTDDLVVNHNILVIPDIKDKFLTDQFKESAEEYGKALYVMDIPQYASDNARIFVDVRGVSSARPDVDATISEFDGRDVNSSYVAAYFPDAKVLDSGDDDEAAINSRRTVRVPPSVVALGALARTDSISQPWFAPAGFSRGALETVHSIDVRLNAEDRDNLYEARINPIANFPNRQFVIFGQKTTQLARTALDRVNVRRLVLEVKRQIEIIAQGLLFEQNNQQTRNSFVSDAGSKLAAIQLNQGIEDFRVVMDETNNSAEDIDNNRLNGKIIIVPTRAVEFIAIDFVITNSGVEFP